MARPLTKFELVLVLLSSCRSAARYTYANYDDDTPPSIIAPDAPVKVPYHPGVASANADDVQFSAAIRTVGHFLAVYKFFGVDERLPKDAFQWNKKVGLPQSLFPVDVKRLPKIN